MGRPIKTVLFLDVAEAYLLQLVSIRADIEPLFMVKVKKIRSCNSGSGAAYKREFVCYNGVA
jgi:ribosomal protein L23